AVGPDAVEALVVALERRRGHLGRDPDPRVGHAGARRRDDDIVAFRAAPGHAVRAGVDEAAAHDEPPVAHEDAPAVRRHDADDLALDALGAERRVEEVAPRDALAGPAHQHPPQLGGRLVVPLAIVAEHATVADTTDLPVGELMP